MEEIPEQRAAPLVARVGIRQVLVLPTMAAAALRPVARQMVEQPERSQVARAARPVAPVAMPMAAAVRAARPVALLERAVPPTWTQEPTAPVTPATPAANNFPPSRSDTI